MWQSVGKGFNIMEKIIFMLIPEIAPVTDQWSPWLEVMGEYGPIDAWETFTFHQFILKVAVRCPAAELQLMMSLLWF